LNKLETRIWLGVACTFATLLPGAAIAADAAPTHTFTSTTPYCWGAGNWTSTTASQANFRDVSKGTLVLSYKKTF
jgi:hypothetical protein